MRKELLAAVTVAAAGAFTLGVYAPPAQAAPTTAVQATAVVRAAAAPKHNNSATEAVYFIHGFDRSAKGKGHNCGSYFKGALKGFRDGGWKGKLITFGYYKTDRGCTVEHPGTRSTPLKTVGQKLAWDIYNRYSRHGKSVDVVAHSMGGLVIRSALTQVAKKAGGWPPYLYVEDVTTISTPHTGTNWARGCTPVHCRDMRPGSGFIKGLYQSPQARQGTDWTLIGADDDAIVTTGSAIGMKAGHKVRYADGQGLGHGNVHQRATGALKMTYTNYYTRGWSGWVKNGASPVVAAKNASYFWWKW
jgi:triacylglycerol esterase/lipase EstA (alpha/beta hydrolase family)